MTIENIIFIKGGEYSDVKQILQDWIDLYGKDLEEGLTFELYETRAGNYMIKTDERLDNERFFYLVNYIVYPIDIDLDADVSGFTTGKDDNILKDQELLVFVSSNDKDGDNVFVTTLQNKNYKVDFGGKIIEIQETKIFSLPPDLKFENPEILKSSKKKQPQEQQKAEKGSDKTLKIIFQIILVAFAASWFAQDNTETFLTINYAIGGGIWGWLFFDYKMLQVSKYYFRVLILSIIIAAYGYYLKTGYADSDRSSLAQIGTILPLFFLVIQRLLRFIFKGAMKREPVVPRPAPTFPDFVYCFILLISTIAIPLILLVERKPS